MARTGITQYTAKQTMTDKKKKAAGRSGRMGIPEGENEETGVHTCLYVRTVGVLLSACSMEHTRKDARQRLWIWHTNRWFVALQESVRNGVR